MTRQGKGCIIGCAVLVGVPFLIYMIAVVFTHEPQAEPPAPADESWTAEPRPSAPAASSAPAAKWLDPNELVVGATYRVSKQTPLCPEIEPADPIAAAAQIKQIPARSTIKIVSSTESGGHAWYQVTACGPAGKALGQGYVNSIALYGQQLGEVKAGP
jgi:hypothetical protein